MNIVGIGLANIDLVAHVDDDFLSAHNLIKSEASKLNRQSFAVLRKELTNVHIEAGGCAGNTLCGIDKKDIKATFFGKIGNDDYAKIYRNSFKKHRVLFPVQNGDIESSQCAVLVTPDGERSFAYMHGASWTLSPDDIYYEAISQADLVYTEIYAMAFGMQTGLWPTLINHLRKSGRTMALKTVDKEYADLYKNALFSLAEEGILKILIGNKDNLSALAKRDTVEETLNVLGKWKCATLLTDGEKGAHYQYNGIHNHHKVAHINNPENTSGAGDQFVAGFLEKWLFDKPIEDCLQSGENKARSVIMSDSPRPRTTENT